MQPNGSFSPVAVRLAGLFFGDGESRRLFGLVVSSAALALLVMVGGTAPVWGSPGHETPISQSGFPTGNPRLAPTIVIGVPAPTGAMTVAGLSTVAPNGPSVRFLPARSSVNDEGAGAFVFPDWTPALGATDARVQPSLSSSAGFAGIDFSGSNCNCAPPDVQLATGASDVTEMVNLEARIWTKSGTLLKSFTLASFFLTGTDSISDPRVLFDNGSGHWFASIVDVTKGAVRFAASQTSDPTGSWFVYQVGSPKGTFPDRPILGVSNNVLAIGANVFKKSGLFVGGEFWIVNKADTVAGSAAAFAKFGPKSTWFSIHPVHSLTSESSQFMVMHVPGTDSLSLFSVTGTPPSTVSFAATSIVIAHVTTSPAARQPGTTKKLDTGDTRVQDAALVSGTIWLALNDGCVPAGDTTTRSCIRFIEVATAPASVVQEFDFGSAGAYVFYPALSLDTSGDLSVIYGTSSSSVYPSLAITGRLAGAAAGTLESPSLLKSGTVADTVACNSMGVCRYGDYFGAGFDPSGPDAWVAGEFVASTSDVWSTWVADIRA